MPHTLKAYYYTHGTLDLSGKVTVDFYGATATNSGIAVTSYQMGVPGIEQARNNSLYSDSPLPVWSKRSTVVDVLTVDVRGSTNTALYTNLHLLAKLGEFARASSQRPLGNLPAYVELKPGGSAAGEVLYAPIYDCRVELPQDWAGTQDARLHIEDVTVTIERGIWQANGVPSFGTSVMADGGAQALAGGKASDADVGGDMASVNTVIMSRTGTPTVLFDRVILGMRSKFASVQYASLGVTEAEAMTNGTDTTDAADATARSGNKVVCSYATVTTNDIRLSGAIVPPGVHRVFARMKATAAASTVYAAYCDETVANGGTLIENTSVTVSSTAWLVYDLGVIHAFQHGYSWASTTNLGTIAIYAAQAAASATLDIDWVFIMPTEQYLTASSLGIGTTSPTANFGLVVSDEQTVHYAGVFNASYDKKVRTATYTYSVSLPPGPFKAYWLVGTDTSPADGTFDVKPVSEVLFTMYARARFLMPSEI